MTTRSRRDVMLAIYFASTLAQACNGEEDGGANEQGQPPTEAELARACAAVEACEGEEGRQECEATFDLFSVPKSCVAAISMASCEEHAQAVPPYTDLCFPPCEGASPLCHRDGTLTQCDMFLQGLRQVRTNCDAVCAELGRSFVTCGRQSGDRSSEEDVCWCDVESHDEPAGDAGLEPPEDAPVLEANAADSQRTCDALEACGRICDPDLLLAVLTPQCVSAVEAAACSEHEQTVPSYYEVCFPRCEQERGFCNEDRNDTSCRQFAGALRWVTWSCERLCESMDLEWSGTCGLPGQCSCVPPGLAP